MHMPTYPCNGTGTFLMPNMMSSPLWSQTQSTAGIATAMCCMVSLHDVTTTVVSDSVHSCMSDVIATAVCTWCYYMMSPPLCAQTRLSLESLSAVHSLITLIKKINYLSASPKGGRGISDFAPHPRLESQGFQFDPTFLYPLLFFCLVL